MQKYNIEKYLLQNNFFNKSQEEIELIYKALKEPDSNEQFLDSLGLTDINVLYRKYVQKLKKREKYTNKRKEMN